MFTFLFAGRSAITTHIIILLVVALERMCGEDDTLNCSLTFVHLFLSVLFYFFFLFASAVFLMEPIACFRWRFAGQT